MRQKIEGWVYNIDYASDEETHYLVSPLTKERFYFWENLWGNKYLRFLRTVKLDTNFNIYLWGKIEYRQGREHKFISRLKVEKIELK